MQTLTVELVREDRSFNIGREREREKKWKDRKMSPMES